MTTKQTVLTMGKKKIYFIMNLKQQDTQHLFYKVVSNLVRREFKNVFFFCLTSNWYGLKRLQIRGTKLSNGLLAKKS